MGAGSVAICPTHMSQIRPVTKLVFFILNQVLPYLIMFFFCNDFSIVVLPFFAHIYPKVSRGEGGHQRSQGQQLGTRGGRGSWRLAPFSLPGEMLPFLCIFAEEAARFGEVGSLLSFLPSCLSFKLLILLYTSNIMHFYSIYWD